MLQLNEKEYSLPAEAEAVHSGAADMAELYDKYRDDVLRYCLKKLGNYEDAVDIVQEVFCRMLAKGDRETIREPRLFLIRTASNLIHDKFRTARRHKEKAHVNLELVSNADLVCPAPSAESRVQSRQAVGVALEALSGLPRKCQAVFVMKLYYGFSYAEIAEELDIASVVGVKKYMMRALGHLRDSLDINEIDTRYEATTDDSAGDASASGSSANGVTRRVFQAAE